MEELTPIRFSLARYFSPNSHKVAISVPELVQQTNEFSTKNRPGCQPTYEKSKHPQELFLRYNVKCKLKESDPNGHDVKVRFDLEQVKDEATAKNLDVEASCSCPAFLWWGAQWNMHQRDALEGEPRPLLTAPTERLDLRGHFVICKHLKAVFERILPSVQHNIVNILRDREVERRKKLEEEKEPKPRIRKKRGPEPSAPTTPSAPPPPPGVIKRDTPATPGEKQRVPVLDREIIPVTPARTPIPMIPELDDDYVARGTRDVPATIKPFTDQDRVNTDRIEHDWELEDKQPLLGELKDDDPDNRAGRDWELEDEQPFLDRLEDEEED